MSGLSFQLIQKAEMPQRLKFVLILFSKPIVPVVEDCLQIAQPVILVVTHKQLESIAKNADPHNNGL